MTEPTLSTRIRAVQHKLSAINNDLLVILDDANHIGLAPFPLSYIQHAFMDTQHAYAQLDQLATSLELTCADRKL